MSKEELDERRIDIPLGKEINEYQYKKAIL